MENRDLSYKEWVTVSFVFIDQKAPQSEIEPWKSVDSGLGPHPSRDGGTQQLQGSQVEKDPPRDTTIYSCEHLNGQTTRAAKKASSKEDEQQTKPDSGKLNRMNVKDIF